MSVRRKANIHQTNSELYMSIQHIDNIFFKIWFGIQWFQSHKIQLKMLSVKAAI